MRYAFVAAAALIMPATPGDINAQHRQQECAVAVEAPQNGGRVTEPAGDVSGTATLPPEGYLWVLVRRQGLSGFWPQGGGSRPVTNGRWQAYATYGKPGELGNFEIAVVVVGPQANQFLMTWVQNAREPYTPTTFPNTLQQCPVRMLVVQKVSG